MFDTVDSRSPIPIYAQIASQVRLAVARGQLLDGDPLPSVRTLAAELRVNPATVVQAYRDLAQEGVVETKHGAGTFVAPVRATDRPKVRAAEAKRLVRAVIEQAARVGLSSAELRQAFNDEFTGDHR